MIRRFVWLFFGVSVFSLALAQAAQAFVPGFRPHNLEASRTIAWDTQQTEKLWQVACADCHSNRTEWPTYSQLAPLSFLIVSQVKQGRTALNIDRQPDIDHAQLTQTLQQGHRPWQLYRVAHPAARLTPAQQARLIQGLQTTFGAQAAQAGTPPDIEINFIQKEHTHQSTEITIQRDEAAPRLNLHLFLEQVQGAFVTQADRQQTPLGTHPE